VFVPALGLGPFLEVGDVGIADAAPLGDQLVLREFVLGLVQPADAQDQQLAIAERQRLLRQDVAGEGRPAFRERGVIAPSP
jgi:hypothetical protein